VDISRAFSYIFDDEGWMGKLVMVVIWSFVSAIPLIGLVGMAALAGYMVDLLANMRQRAEHPLPEWDNLGDKIGDGANVLIAGLVYNLGNFLMACGAFLLLPTFGIDGTGDAGGGALVIICCLTVFLILYNLLVWPFLAVGTLRYAHVRQISVFFQFSEIWDTLNRNMGATLQWVLFSIFASLVISFFNIIPCLGWLASIALALPVQGHLLGQYDLLMAEKPKGKPKRS
jgi:hypothetical protein